MSLGPSKPKGLHRITSVSLKLKFVDVQDVCISYNGIAQTNMNIISSLIRMYHMYSMYVFVCCESWNIKLTYFVLLFLYNNGVNKSVCHIILINASIYVDIKQKSE